METKAFVVKSLTNPPDIELSEGQVILVMSEEEASALLALTGKCIANGVTTRVYYALTNANVDHSMSVYNRQTKTGPRTLATGPFYVES